MNKMHRLFCFFCVCLLSPYANAQSLFDDFNASSVNGSLWNVILPFGQSSISESGGFLTTTGRGTLATVAGFDSPLTISGNVTLNNQNEHFYTILRTDLSLWPAGASYHEITGIVVGFSADANQISIGQLTAGQDNPIFLALGSFNFTVGQAYNFEITDDKTTVTLAINGTELLSGSSTFASGNLIGFSSREFGDTSSSLDFVSIQPVPEPSTVAMFGVGILALLGMRKSKAI